jgi:hypothetical protein
MNLNMSYVAPIKDMLFAMNELAGLDQINAIARLRRRNVLRRWMRCSKRTRAWSSDVIAPLNRIRRRAAQSSWKDGEVKTTPGFKQAFTAYGAAAAGKACSIRIEFGGQGLPKLVATPCMEMLNARTCRLPCAPC